MNKTWNNGRKKVVKRHGKGSKYKAGASSMEKAAETTTRQSAKKAIEESLTAEPLE